MKRRAQAVWRGEGLKGSGELKTGSGALDGQPYSAKLRFENEDGEAGTNPEELIAAAHAGCFAMALSFQLSGAGHAPDELTVNSELTMDQNGNEWTIRAIHLNLKGRVPGMQADQFEELAQKAKAGCPVSRALNVEITLSAELQGA